MTKPSENSRQSEPRLTGGASGQIGNAFVRVACESCAIVAFGRPWPLSSTAGVGIGSVAAMAIAQNCRCMRVIQVVLIECMMAEEFDVDNVEALQKKGLCVYWVCLRISPFLTVSSY